MYLSCVSLKKSLNSLIYNRLRIKALFVRAKGLEPIRTKAPDPKSGLATNYNTPAPLCPAKIVILVNNPKMRLLILGKGRG